MPTRALPQWLNSVEALENLVTILLEKEALLKTIKARDFGPSISNAQEAQRTFSRVIQITRVILGIDALKLEEPELIFTQRLGRLHRRITALFAMLLPFSLFAFVYSTWVPERHAAALWVVRGVILLLLIIPFIMGRRARINIEHQCGYVKSHAGRSVIVIDQLPAIQFQSYLAHEYSHHLYFYAFDGVKEAWRREGWARLLQWQVALRLCRLEGNPAYLYHALVQIIGELKFACEIMSSSLNRKLPRDVMRIRTIYHANPLYRFITGTPGFSLVRLMDHAIGTASYFLAEKRLGACKALSGEWWPEDTQTEVSVHF